MREGAMRNALREYSYRCTDIFASLMYHAFYILLSSLHVKYYCRNILLSTPLQASSDSFDL